MENYEKDEYIKKTMSWYRKLTTQQKIDLNNNRS